MFTDYRPLEHFCRGPVQQFVDLRYGAKCIDFGKQKHDHQAHSTLLQLRIY
jgi:hypothetical protein